MYTLYKYIIVGGDLASNDSTLSTCAELYHGATLNPILAMPVAQISR